MNKPVIINENQNSKNVNKVVEDINVSIPKDPEKSKACYEWLDDNGLGDIIKNQVGMSFGKGEGNKAKHLEESIKEMGLIPEVKVSVHPSTLKATFRKWHEEGRSCSKGSQRTLRL